MAIKSDVQCPLMFEKYLLFSNAVGTKFDTSFLPECVNERGKTISDEPSSNAGIFVILAYKQYNNVLSLTI